MHIIVFIYLFMHIPYTGTIYGDWLWIKYMFFFKKWILDLVPLDQMFSGTFFLNNFKDLACFY